MTRHDITTPLAQAPCETAMILAGKRMVETEAAWEAALDETFGVQARDMRYTPAGDGAPGTQLRAAFTARNQAFNRFEDLKIRYRLAA